MPKPDPQRQLVGFHDDVDRLIDGRARRAADDVFNVVLAELRTSTVRRGSPQQNAERVSRTVHHLIANDAVKVVNAVSGEMVGIVNDAIADSQQRTLRMVRAFEGSVPRVLRDNIRQRTDRAEVARTMNAEYHRSVTMGWGVEMRALVERVARESASVGDKPHIMLAKIDEAIHAHRWRVELSASYSAASAYNAAQDRSVRALHGTMPDIRKRWTERIDDATGRPYDDKVAPDSFVLHGQVVAGDRLFEMPADSRAPHRMIGATWPHPPNRPNDRAVITPWRRGWGIPAYEIVNGRRRALR
jgi:hypothetical protein